jgi:hypothetical protein
MGGDNTLKDRLDSSRRGMHAGETERRRRTPSVAHMALLAGLMFNL